MVEAIFAVAILLVMFACWAWFVIQILEDDE